MVEIIKVLASYINAEIEAHTLEMGDGQFTAGTVVSLNKE
jgi:hypothetical protein